MNFFRTEQENEGKKPLKHLIPHLLTSSHLLCGMSSLMLTFHGHFIPAAWVILLAVLFDILDGRTARKLGCGSHFGLEYDSLADLVSFGVAPAMAIYVSALKGFGGIAGAVAAAFFVMSVALRLARFNVKSVPGPYQGLPSPAGGLFMMSLILAGLPIGSFPTIMFFVVIITGFLMISDIPYSNLKKLTKDNANKAKCLLLFGALALVIILLRETAFLVVLMIYIVSGPMRFDWEGWLLLPAAPATE